MQPHEQHDPEQRKPDPQDKRAMWLLLVIAILLGLITTRPAGSAILLGRRTPLRWCGMPFRCASGRFTLS